MGAGLAVGFVWALSLVPEAFLRFVILTLGNTIYRVRVIGRENIPREGHALLVPNHVSFVDGLFIMASTDRPVRFVIYAEYFQKPFMGWVLRAMRAIPITSTDGPRMILQAFREAGKALDAGELVCIFPEGQLTRTGLMAPFQRGLQRIVKGRTTPIIPVHLDRIGRSIFAPVSGRRLPERIPFPVTVSIGPPCPRPRPSSTCGRRFEGSIPTPEAFAKGNRDRSITSSSARRAATPGGSPWPSFRSRRSRSARRSSPPWPWRGGSEGDGRDRRTSGSCFRPAWAGRSSTWRRRWRARRR